MLQNEVSLKFLNAPISSKKKEGPVGIQDLQHLMSKKKEVTWDPMLYKDLE